MRRVGKPCKCCSGEEKHQVALTIGNIVKEEQECSSSDGSMSASSEGEDEDDGSGTEDKDQVGGKMA